MKKIFRSKKNKHGVSEVLGTILLLGIAVAIFSVLYFVVLSENFETEKPYPTVVTFVEGDHIVIEHRGGEELGVDNKFTFNIGGNPYTFYLSGLLEDTNSDDKWNIGERLILKGSDIYIDSDTIFNWTTPDADLSGNDLDNNRIIMSGLLDIRPSGDIGLEVFVDNTSPKVGDSVNITLTVSLYYGDLSAPYVQIKYLLPDSLEFWEYYPKSANYNKTTGIWNITNLNIGVPVSLTIKANVSLTAYKVEPTQLCMLIDGSGSIRGPGGNQPGPDWDLILNGLSKAVNESIPHDGNVELTIIQFAQNEATLEIGGPVVITESNYQSVAANIRNINQRGSWTPMSCGIQKGADTLFVSPRNPLNGGIFTRKVIFLVTDGQPTCRCLVSDSDPYISDYCGYDYESTSNTEDSRDYLLNKLGMDENIDEFDSLAIGVGPDINWLRDGIVWPGSSEWTGDEEPEPGWVRHVDDWAEFSNAIDETFVLLFGKIDSSIELLNSPLIDLTDENNRVTLTINPVE